MSFPKPLVEIKVTEYVAAVVYVLEGFWAVEVLPSPKSQAHDVGTPLDKSLKLTVVPSQTVDGPLLKLATGVSGTSVVYTPKPNPENPFENDAVKVRSEL